jgi:hypothetical protein
MQDLRPLRRISESLRKMADVNLVHHYARLAQMVTDTTGDRSSVLNTPAEKPGLIGRHIASAGSESFGHYFSGTPLYYHVSQCDVTNLKRWTLSTCRSLGLDFSMFSFPYGFYEELNGFVKIAETKQFLHDVNFYKLPSIATLSARNLHWLVANRKSDDGRPNLFYILTSLLTPREGASEQVMSAGVQLAAGPRDSSQPPNRSRHGAAIHRDELPPRQPAAMGTLKSRGLPNRTTSWRF